MLSPSGRRSRQPFLSTPHAHPPQQDRVSCRGPPGSHCWPLSEPPRHLPPNPTSRRTPSPCGPPPHSSAHNQEGRSIEIQRLRHCGAELLRFANFTKPCSPEHTAEAQSLILLGLGSLCPCLVGVQTCPQSAQATAETPGRFTWGVFCTVKTPQVRRAPGVLEGCPWGLHLPALQAHRARQLLGRKGALSPGCVSSEGRWAG